MLKKICQVVTRETHAPGDIIFEEGEWASSMYFIIKGKVKLVSRSHAGATIGYLSEGGYFGEVALFMETSRSVSAKCLSFCDTICLSRQSLVDLLVIYPKFRDKYDALCREVLSGDVRGLCLQCIHCGKSGHLSD
ncbi:voltage and ligand gated potassium channel, putative, partial [Perkinsus marinus ATCC 50983]